MRHSALVFIQSKHRDSFKDSLADQGYQTEMFREVFACLCVFMALAKAAQLEQKNIEYFEKLGRWSIKHKVHKIIPHVNWLARLVNIENEEANEIIPVTIPKLAGIRKVISECTSEEKTNCMVKEIEEHYQTLLSCDVKNQYQAIRALDQFLTIETAVIMAQRDWLKTKNTLIDAYDALKVGEVSVHEKNGNTALNYFKQELGERYHESMLACSWFLINQLSLLPEFFEINEDKKKSFILKLLGKNLKITNRTSLIQLGNCYIIDESVVEIHRPILKYQIENAIFDLNSARAIFEKRNFLKATPTNIYRATMRKILKNRETTKSVLDGFSKSLCHTRVDYELLKLEPLKIDELISHAAINSSFEMVLMFILGVNVNLGFSRHEAFRLLLSIPKNIYEDFIGALKDIKKSENFLESRKEMTYLQFRFPYLNITKLFSSGKRFDKLYAEEVATKNKDTKDLIAILPDDLDFSEIKEFINKPFMKRECYVWYKGDWEEQADKHFQQFITSVVLFMLKKEQNVQNAVIEYLGIIYTPRDFHLYDCDSRTLPNLANLRNNYKLYKKTLGDILESPNELDNKVQEEIIRRAASHGETSPTREYQDVYLRVLLYLHTKNEKYIPQFSHLKEKILEQGPAFEYMPYLSDVIHLQTKYPELDNKIVDNFCYHNWVGNISPMLPFNSEKMIEIFKGQSDDPLRLALKEFLCGYRLVYSQMVPLYTGWFRLFFKKLRPLYITKAINDAFDKEGLKLGHFNFIVLNTVSDGLPLPVSFLWHLLDTHLTYNLFNWEEYFKSLDIGYIQKDKLDGKKILGVIKEKNPKDSEEFLELFNELAIQYC